MATYATSSLYVDEQQMKILSDPFRVVNYRFELLDYTYAPKMTLKCIKDGWKISYGTLDDIKRKLNVQYLEVDPDEMREIDWMNDWIKVWCDVTFTDPKNGKQTLSYPLGVFVMNTAKRSVSGDTVTRDIQGYDLSKFLADDLVEEVYNVFGDEYPTDKVNELLQLSGLQSNIQFSDNIQDTARSWDIGTSKLTIINDLLDAIGFTKLVFDAEGTAQAEPYIAPSKRNETITYATDNNKVLGSEVAQSLDTSVPNVVVVVASQPDRPPLVARLYNYSPDSPTSIPNRGGKRFTKFIADNETATSQAALNAKALRIFSDISQVYEAVEISTKVMPIHGDSEIILINYTEGDNFIAGHTFSEMGWDITANDMTHSLRRVVDISGGDETDDE